MDGMSEKFVQTTIDCELYKKLGNFCLDHDITIKAVVRKAIQKFLGEAI